jgi:hypothetical protein
MGVQLLQHIWADGWPNRGEFGPMSLCKSIFVFMCLVFGGIPFCESTSQPKNDILECLKRRFAAIPLDVQLSFGDTGYTHSKLIVNIVKSYIITHRIHVCHIW